MSFAMMTSRQTRKVCVIIFHVQHSLHSFSLPWLFVISLFLFDERWKYVSVLYKFLCVFCRERVEWLEWNKKKFKKANDRTVCFRQCLKLRRCVWKLCNKFLDAENSMKTNQETKFLCKVRKKNLLKGHRWTNASFFRSRVCLIFPPLLAIFNDCHYPAQFHDNPLNSNFPESFSFKAFFPNVTQPAICNTK